MSNPLPSYQLRFPYRTTISGVTLSHRLNLGVRVDSAPAEDTAFEAIDVELNSGVIVSLDEYYTTLFPLIAACFSTVVEFPVAELWHYPPGDTNGIYISSAAVGDNGTNAASPVSAAEAIITFRCKADVLMKISLQETFSSSQAKLAYPSSIASQDALAVHILGLTGAIVGRADKTPIACLYMNGGQNEATWRRRNRPR